MSILTNTSAMVALQTLKGINRNLAMVQSEISTGKKVANARDNAAIFAISTVMQSDVSGFKGISESLSLGSSTVGLARNASESVTSLLQEMKTKIVAAQSNNVDRTKIQTDVSALRDQVASVVNAAQFNGLNFIKGGGSVDILASLDRASNGTVSASNISVGKNDLQATVAVFGVAGALSITTASATPIADAASETVTFTATAIVVGASFRVTLGGTDYDYVARDGDSLNDVGAGLKTEVDAAGITGIATTLTKAADPITGNVVLSFANTSGAAVTLAAVDNSGGTAGGGLAALSGLDVTTDAGATSALSAIETLINTAIDAASAFGSSQNRIDIQSDFVGKLVDSMKAGIGSLIDADLEESSARLQALQVQQQLGIQALSIANQAPQNILALFR